ncbi:MAG TPA: SUMF1/EgtB/PvdO family nonheme iron enzyme [Verrucomicrobiae bacterium]|nr:SUMF1/EgtB/PvdO family nonheme iron enzyme [Verrucomicrobiae bacterium]
MPNPKLHFGNYEAVQELFSSLAETRYLARPIGSQESPGYVIKVFHPQRMEPGTLADDPRVAAFVAGARFQRDLAREEESCRPKQEEPVAAARTAVTLPLEDVQLDQRGGWYVARRYPTTLARLIEHRVRLDAHSIYALILQIQGWLQTLRTRHGRSHGNLRARHILIQHSGGDLLEADVAVSELESVLRESHERDDLWHLGEILYQLVRAEPVRVTDQRALAADWERVFGNRAADWRKLCRDLLDRDLSLEQLPLEVVGERLRKLKPPPARAETVLSMLFASAPISGPLALVLCAVVWLRQVPDQTSVAWLQAVARWTGSARVYPAAWEERRQAEGWLRGLMGGTGAKEAWAKNDERLGIVLRRLTQVAKKKELPQNDADRPPLDVNKHWKELKSQVQVVRDVRLLLENWPKRTYLEVGARRFARRNWLGPADELKRSVNLLQFGRTNNCVSAIQQILTADEQLRAIETQWRAITNLSEHPGLVLPGWSRSLQQDLSMAANLHTLRESIERETKYALSFREFIQSEWVLLPPERKSVLPPPLSIASFRSDLERWMVTVRAEVTNLAPSRDFLLRYRILRSAAVDREWDGLRNRVTRRVPADLWTTNLNKARVLLSKLADEFPAAEFDTNGIQVALLAPLREAASTNRELMLEQLLKRIQWSNEGTVSRSGVDQETAAVEAEYREQLKRIARFGRDSTEFPHRLALGYADLDGWQEFRVLEDHPALQEIFSPLREFENLRTNASLTAGDLHRQVTSPEAPLALAWAAWQRLTKTSASWLTNLTALETQADADYMLRQRLGKIPEANRQRREELLRQLQTNADALVVACFEVGGDDTHIAQGLNTLRTREAFPASPYSNATAYNLLLNELRAGDWSKMLIDELGTNRSELIRLARGLPSTQRDESVLAALAQVDLARKLPGPFIPPELVRGRKRWREECSPNGELLTYRWTNNAGFMDRLEFALVGQSADPFYLCTTEVSVGLVADWVEAWKTDAEATELTNAIPAFKTGSTTDLRGIHTWTRRSGSPRPLEPAPKWIETTVLNWPLNTPLEFTALEPPNQLTPITYVSPQAANLIARWMGFRLPTTNEWLAAYATSRTGKPNLRDETWAKQRDYAASHAKASMTGIPWPDWNNAAFRYPGLAPDLIEARAIALTNYNDRYLWFAPVMTDSAVKFSHLVGNVAEYLLQPEADKFFVIGGSALSDPRVPQDRPYPVGLAKRGFADVGFRMACEGQLSPAQELRWLVMNKLKYAPRLPPSG